MRGLIILMSTFTVLVCVAQEESRIKDKLNLRLGWVYGVGGELEYRPNQVGISIGAGYVPKSGFGGYLGFTLAQNKIDERGFVLEAGTYYGIENTFREYPDGLGFYSLIGYNFILLKKITLKVMPGFGLPFQENVRPEFLMKLTFGRK